VKILRVTSSVAHSNWFTEVSARQKSGRVTLRQNYLLQMRQEIEIHEQRSSEIHQRSNQYEESSYHAGADYVAKGVSANEQRAVELNVDGFGFARPTCLILNKPDGR
jgi:hypothetical protein